MQWFTQVSNRNYYFLVKCGLEEDEDEGVCCRMKVCVPTNLYVEILTPNMVLLGDGAFGR